MDSIKEEYSQLLDMEVLVVRHQQNMFWPKLLRKNLEQSSSLEDPEDALHSLLDTLNQRIQLA